MDVQATDFEQGRVVTVPGRARIKLEDVVPLAGQMNTPEWEALD
ncbi:MAG TPA: hypothetical protein VJ898_00735 [Natrialbaceae archaeon]|nr:hypothetical protein [Natrialbaceae archaeon]